TIAWPCPASARRPSRASRPPTRSSSSRARESSRHETNLDRPSWRVGTQPPAEQGQEATTHGLHLPGQRTKHDLPYPLAPRAGQTGAGLRHRPRHEPTQQAVRPRTPGEPEVSHAGYEPIVIDGIECEIGWTSTDYSDGDDICWEEHWAVLRHGCEIGKSPDRDQAIADAIKTLQHPPSAWLLRPKPDRLS